MDPITGYIVSALIGLALQGVSTLAQQWFGTKSDKATGGMRGQYSTGGTVNMTIVLGTYGVSGQLEYSNTWGPSGKTPTSHLTDVISLSDYRITGVAAQWIDSNSITIPTTGVVTQGYPVTVPSKFDGYAWNILYDGSQSTADAYLLAKFGSDAERPWLSDMIGPGISYAIQTARINETLYREFPRYMYEVQGAPVFDPRESTAAGGSGSQVWGTFSTYAFSDNPIVLIYNILRGLHDADGNFIWGGHAEAYQLPYAEWAAAADLCDTLVDLAAGGTEKRYRAGIEISLNERPADIIRDLLIACNARMSFARGQYHILVDVPASADASFTDGDLLIEQAIDFSQFPNLDDALNGATATYLEPERAWEERETAPYYRSDLETEDGQLNRESMGLRCVFSGTQAQRILKAVIEESRRFKRAVVCLPPTFGAYRPLQVLSWTSIEFQYSSKLFLITNRTTDEWGRVWFALLEIDPADFDWDEEIDETALTFASTEPNDIPVQEADDFDAEGTTFLDNDGADRRPGILVTVAADLDDVRAVLVQVTLDGSSDVEFDQELPYDPAVTEIVLPKSFLPATDYEVRGKYIPFDGSGRTTNFSSWIPVTTPDVRLGPADLGDTLANMVDYLSLSVRDINELMQLATSGAADQDLANYADRKYVINKQVVGDDVTYAASVQALLLAVGVDGTSLVDAINAIEAASGDVTAGFLSRITTSASPGGSWVRYGQQIKAAHGASFVTVSDFWEVNSISGLSRRVMKATETYFVDDAGNIIAMFGAAGTFIAKAAIPELTVEKLEIAARGLTFEGISFEHNVTTVGGAAVANSAAWTAGTVRYVNDAGTVTSAAISAGSIAWTTGVGYVYWVKGATTFSTTTTAATAFATNNVVIAAYRGGTDLVVTFGKTIIDGTGGIKSLSVDTPSLTDEAATDLLEDASLSAAAVIAALEAGTGTNWSEVGSIAVTGTDYPVSVATYLRFDTPTGTSGFTWWTLITVEVGGNTYRKDYTNHGAKAVGDTIKATHGVSVIPGPGTATVKIWIGTNGTTVPTSIHADSSFTGAFTKK